jgi:hypothetical protein
MTEYWYWKCAECGYPWRIRRELIEAKKQRGEKILLGCKNCGLINGPQGDFEVVEDGPKTWLPCIIFTGPEARLSPGTPSGNLWKGADGKTYTLDEYAKKYLINPKINFEWRQKGMPRYEE